MSKILELRSKRNALWEQTKAFLEKNRGENGLVAPEAVEQYNKMAQEVKNLGTEIERLEQQAQLDAQLAAPTSTPIHGTPKAGVSKDKETRPTATEEYRDAFWNMIRARGNYGEIHNALSIGQDSEGGYTVPDEFERRLVQALEENNIFRGLATVIRTSSGTRKIPIALVRENDIIRKRTAQSRRDGRGASVRRLYHIAVKILVIVIGAPDR